MSAEFKDQLVHLQKREGKLTREAAADRKRIQLLEHQVTQLIRAVRGGLPHMNLSEFLDDPKQNDD